LIDQGRVGDANLIQPAAIDPAALGLPGSGVEFSAIDQMGHGLQGVRARRSAGVEVMMRGEYVGAARPRLWLPL
jgi:hypothetical protein